MGKLLTTNKDLKSKIGVVGGGKRELYAARFLKNDGYKVKIYGVLGDVSDKDAVKSGEIAHSLADCVRDVDAVVLPLPFLNKDGFINATGANITPNDLLKEIPKGCRVFGGRLTAEFIGLCKKFETEAWDYSVQPEFEIKNAVPTAEGAIGIAVKSTEKVICGSRCLVVGWGRIGKVLAKNLMGLGAKVIVSARKDTDLAWIKAAGCDCCHTGDISKIIGDCDIVFNTVPYRIIDRKVLEKTKHDVVIADLASYPGGVDKEALVDIKRNVVWALGIPGKAMPKTAGKIVGETIANKLREV